MADPYSKLSPQTRRLLAERRTEDDDGRPVDVLIRMRADAEVKTLQQVEGKAGGAQVRTVAGDVATASAPLGALLALAELHEVVAIEVTTPLEGEAPPTG